MNKKIIERCLDKHIKAIDILARNCPKVNTKCLRIGKLICEDLLEGRDMAYVTVEEFEWVRPGPNPNSDMVEFGKICKEYEPLIEKRKLKDEKREREDRIN